MPVLPCFLCGKQLNQRTDKNRKPYFVCDPCGIQLFIRRKQGIEKLAQFIRSLNEHDLHIRQHAQSLYEVQAILSEIDGLKTEIKKLDGEIGFFFVDEDKLRARKLLKTRIENLLSRLEKIFAMAGKWSFYSGGNPASGVDLPEKRAVREKHVLTPDQISRLLALGREPVRTMVLLGILTGMRIGEILGLRWKDVDFASGQIRVEQAVYRGLIGSPKTKGSRRILPLPQFLMAVLADLCRDSTWSQEDLVFRTRNGTPHNDTNLLHRELKPAGRQIGAPWLSWHTLRRTHATLLQAAGGSLKDAQAQLGHSKLSTTLEIYTIPIPAHQRAAVEKLWDLLTNVDELRQIGKGLPERVQQIQ